MRGAGVARRADSTTVLDFAFLVYKDGDSWIGRSVHTGHVAESATPQRAVLNLIRAIDTAIEIAERHGFSATQWYEAQRPDEARFIQMFVATLCQGSPKHESVRARDGRVVLNTAIAQQKAA